MPSSFGMQNLVVQVTTFLQAFLVSGYLHPWLSTVFKQGTQMVPEAHSNLRRHICPLQAACIWLTAAIASRLNALALFPRHRL